MNNALRTMDKEQYYTRNDVAEKLVKAFQKKSPLIWNHIKTIVEPSVGDGAFFKALKNVKGKQFFGFDIDPRIKGSNIYKQDFLKLNEKKYITDSPDRVLIVGNPPFGRHGALAKQFINKCAEFSDYIFMILPVNIAFGQNGLSGINEYLHIKWSIRLPATNIWVDTKGNFYDRSIRTAAILFVLKDKKRVKKEIIKEGNGWRFIDRDESVRPSDIVIFRYHPKASFAGSSASEINRNANHVIRFKNKVSKTLLNLMDKDLHDFRKNETKNSTTGMINITIPQVFDVINNVV